MNHPQHHRIEVPRRAAGIARILGEQVTIEYCETASATTVKRPSCRHAARRSRTIRLAVFGFCHCQDLDAGGPRVGRTLNLLHAAASAHLKLFGKRARLLNRQFKDTKKQLGAALEQCDATIIQTMLGIGMIVAATLLGEAGELLRARDDPALRASQVLPPSQNAVAKSAASSGAPPAIRDYATRPTTGHAWWPCAIRSRRPLRGSPSSRHQRPTNRICCFCARHRTTRHRTTAGTVPPAISCRFQAAVPATARNPARRQRRRPGPAQIPRSRRRPSQSGSAAASNRRSRSS